MIWEQGYYKSLLRSLGLAFLTTAILLVVCWPLAYGMAKVFGRFTLVITILVMLILFVSENIRLFGSVLSLMLIVIVVLLALVPISRIDLDAIMGARNEAGVPLHPDRALPLRRRDPLPAVPAAGLGRLRLGLEGALPQLSDQALRQ